MKKLTSFVLLAAMLALLTGVAFATTTYTVTLGPTAFGVIATSTSSAAENATVTITAVPSEGYSLALLSVIDASGKSVTVNTLSEASYSFKMPAANVTVSATFVVSSTGTTSYSDVAKTDWFYDAVAYVSDKELMTGTNGAFDPNGTMSRGMVVTILYRLAGSPGLVGQPDFTDVPASSWCAKPALWAAQNNISSGYGNGAFGVDDPVTREQFVAFLCRYARLRSYDTSASAALSGFSDAAAVDSYALAPMQWAVGTGILQGSSGSLTPRAGMTRAQSAAVLMRFCRLYVK